MPRSIGTVLIGPGQGEISYFLFLGKPIFKATYIFLELPLHYTTVVVLWRVDLAHLK